MQALGAVKLLSFGVAGFLVSAVIGAGFLYAKQILHRSAWRRSDPRAPCFGFTGATLILQPFLLQYVMMLFLSTICTSYNHCTHVSKLDLLQCTYNVVQKLTAVELQFLLRVRTS